MIFEDETKQMYRIVCIVGNRRPDNYTAKALSIVAKALQAKGALVTTFDGQRMELNFPDQVQTKDAAHLCEELRASDAVVLATPEYQGCFSAYTKLIIENLGYPSVLSGKAMSLLGVASGRIGAVKSLEQLRTTCAHIGAVVLPQAISVSDVRSVFSEDGICQNPHVEKILVGQAEELLAFLNKRKA